MARGDLMRDHQMPKMFLRLEEVCKRTGLSRATIYRLVSEAKFPKQKNLTSFCRGWLESDVDQWIDDIAQGKAYTPRLPEDA